ncbi:sporulation peptidase YabG [Salimicrobium halophilum]|uniref:Spore coat assemly protein n=1 Tax=Salimicrobium halophilum TaxID=86666 RepID=A0A1G8W1S0_9BACI|nr:sporulation peptidase YabG [Salimicrobium halophilum]SDJ72272.1 spore coat assemly protein [Salimicrobium halophilum]
MLKKGDLVTRYSYNHDVVFRIIDIQEDDVYLQGEELRLKADAPYEDVSKLSDRDYEAFKNVVEEQEDYSYRLFRQDYRLLKEARKEKASKHAYEKKGDYFQVPPRILHIDGDSVFLKRCIRLYEKLGLRVHGQHVRETEMPDKVLPLIEKVQPEIVILTGHDAYLKGKGEKTDLQAYRYSRYYAETVRTIRRQYPGFDQLVIFAGACQSHFEHLIQAGANFASSPARVNIHAIDPVYIAARVAYTSFMEHMDIWQVVRNTVSGTDGLGGVETRGMLRIGMPAIEDFSHSFS